jgi:GTPase involved in cell partitioning and DNA repair
LFGLFDGSGEDNDMTATCGGVDSGFLQVMLFLQLRLMADVALVGLPNVGKSSLIAALTGARAQVRHTTHTH